MIVVPGDAVGDALQAALLPIRVSVFDERRPAYDGHGGCLGVPAPSLAVATALRARGGVPLSSWTTMADRIGQTTIEPHLNGEGGDAVDPVLDLARAAGMLSGSAAVLCALQGLRDVLLSSLADATAVELWAVKWGFEAFVFRCAVERSAGPPTVVALNVARDTTAAADAVRAAGAALVEDFARDPDHVVACLGTYEARLGSVRVPVVITQWATSPDTGADLEELHIYAPHGPQFFLWRSGGANDRALPLEASRRVWWEAIANLGRYSWELPNGEWCIDQLGIGAGDLVGDGDRIVTKVWSRKCRGASVRRARREALLAHATDGDAVVFLGDPAFALAAFTAGLPAATHGANMGGLEQVR